MSIRVIKTGSTYPGKHGNEATAIAYRKVNENFIDVTADIQEVDQRVTDIEENIINEIDGGSF